MTLNSFCTILTRVREAASSQAVNIIARGIVSFLYTKIAAS